MTFSRNLTPSWNLLFVLVASSMFAAGSGGCSPHLTRDPASYTISESNVVNKVNVVELMRTQTLFPLAASKTLVAMVDANTNSQDAEKIDPARIGMSRTLSVGDPSIFFVLLAIRSQPQDHANWIISTSPAVVAVGGSKVEPALFYGATIDRNMKTAIGYGLTLVSDVDMGIEVTELRVADEEVPPLRVAQERSALKVRTRVVHLVRPMTLREVFDTRPWDAWPR